MPPIGDIESRIDSMFGLTGQDGGNNSAPQIEGEAENAQQDTTTADQQDNAQQETAQPNADGQRDTSTSESNVNQPSTQPPAQRQNTPQQQPPQQRLPANAKGDLIDPTTGQVVARAGNERRYYEAARNATNEMRRVQGEVARLTEQLNTYREVSQMPQQLGLQPQETMVAMQFMAHWKRDPVGAATKVLTELRAMGYDVEGLAPTVDVNAIRQVVTDAVSPFQQDRERAAREAEIAAAVDRELNALFSEFDWAQGQQVEIQNLLESNPTLTLREAALTLETYALRRGFDLSKPLREQVLAAQNGMSNGHQPPAQQQPQQQRANNAMLPAPTANNTAPVVPRRSAAMGHDRSNRDIVREAMREAGFNVENL